MRLNVAACCAAMGLCALMACGPGSDGGNNVPVDDAGVADSGPVASGADAGEHAPDAGGHDPDAGGHDPDA